MAWKAPGTTAGATLIIARAVRRADRRPPGRRAAARGDRRLRGRDGPYGLARVADSLAQNGSSGNDPLHKPVVGRVMLAATRGYFPRRGPHPGSKEELPQ